MSSADDRRPGGNVPRNMDDELRIPVVEEQLQVGKREHVTGGVRVHTRVTEEQVDLSEILARQSVEIERVPVGIEVEEAPQPYERDDLLIIPIVEERLVVEKRLFVKEEIRLHRRSSSERVEIQPTRRVMHAEVEELQPETGKPGR